MANWDYLPVRDFSGGMTDNYIDGPINSFKKGHNLLIGKDATLYTRPGSEPIVASSPVNIDIASGRQMYTFDKWLFLVTKEGQFFYYDPYIYGDFYQVKRADYSDDDSYVYAFNVDNVKVPASFARMGDRIYIATGDYVRRLTYGTNRWGTIENAGLREANETYLDEDNVTSGTYNFYYYFVFRQDYTSEYGTTYTVRGKPHRIYAASVADPSLEDSSVPFKVFFYDNGYAAFESPYGHPHPAILWQHDKQSWNISAIKMEVYRTIGVSGTGGIPNPDTARLIKTLEYAQATDNKLDWSDNYSHDLPVTGESLYSLANGGTEYSLPPRAYYCASANNTIWYGRTFDHRNRVYQSISGSGDMVPEGWYNEFDDEVTGLSAIGNIPIAFINGNTFRLEGLRTEALGSTVARRISDRYGCISNASIVAAPQGLYFWSLSGLCFTNGSTVQLVTDSTIKKSYRQYLDNMGPSNWQEITGKLDKENSRVYWSFRSSKDVADNDRFLVYDENQSASGSAVTTELGGDYRFQCQAFEIPDSTRVGYSLVRVGRDGIVYAHKDGLTSDKTVPSRTSPFVSYNAPIVYDLESVAYSFGAPFDQKECTYVVVVCTDDTPIHMQIYENKDTSEDDWQELDPIVFDNDNWTVGNDDVVVGSTDSSVSHKGVASFRRMFNNNYYRCHYKQLKFMNLMVDQYDSSWSSYKTATYDYESSSEITVQLASATAWPSDIIGSYIYLSSDNYRTGHEIISVDDDTITLRPFAGDSETLSELDWKIKHYKPDETLKLIGYKIRYQIIGDIDGIFSRAG